MSGPKWAASRPRFERAANAPAALRKIVKPYELAQMIDAGASLREREAAVRLERVAIVRELRGRGASWDSVGWVLGITGAGVRKVYGRDVAQ